MQKESPKTFMMQTHANYAICIPPPPAERRGLNPDPSILRSQKKKCKQNGSYPRNASPSRLARLRMEKLGWCTSVPLPPPKPPQIGAFVAVRSDAKGRGLPKKASAVPFGMRFDRRPGWCANPLFFGVLRHFFWQAKKSAMPPSFCPQSTAD